MATLDASGDRLRFLKIEPEIREHLQDAWKSILPDLPDLLEAFYAHVRSIPELAAMVGDDAKVERLKGAQKRHWETVFTGVFDAEYMRRAHAIGRAHFRIGLEPRWYLAGYSFVLCALMHRMVKDNRWQTKHMRDELEAVFRAIFLDMDIAISVYQRELIDEIKRRGDNRDHACESFNAVSEQAMGGIREAIGDLKNASRTMSGIAARTLEQATGVAAASEQTSTNVQTVASAAEQLSTAIAEIGQRVGESSTVADRAVTEARQADETVRSLADVAQSIGQVVTLISEIAAQTNLLALNATIEAARAGESGKGFAVVASEVKGLAAQTAKATEEIATQVDAIRGVADTAVVSLKRIQEVISQNSEITTAIAASVEEQGAATQEIARNVTQAAEGTRDVSETIADMTTATHQSNDAAEAVLTAASTTAEQTEVLRQAVEQFFVRLRDA